MKRLVIPVLAGLGLCFAQFSASAQEYKTFPKVTAVAFVPCFWISKIPPQKKYLLLK